MKLRDKFGWPVVTFKRRPVLNLLRRLIHTNLRRTWTLRHRQVEIVATASGEMTSKGQP